MKVSGLSEFEEARLRRLAAGGNSDTSAEDALAIAGDWLRQNGREDTEAIIVMQRPEGGVVVFTARATLAESVFFLEAAKQVLMISYDGEG